jgi:uncharacterized membrane protein
VSGTDWLVGMHILGAVLFVGGSVAVGVLYEAAVREERPSEVAELLRSTRPGVAVVGAGALLTLGPGLALVHRSDNSFGASWIVAAIALWTLSMLLGAIGGRRARHARYLAERLAAEGDRPSDELRLALADRRARALNYGSFLAVLAVLALMLWQP